MLAGGDDIDGYIRATCQAAALQRGMLAGGDGIGGDFRATCPVPSSAAALQRGPSPAATLDGFECSNTLSVPLLEEASHPRTSAERRHRWIHSNTKTSAFAGGSMAAWDFVRRDVAGHDVTGELA